MKKFNIVATRKIISGFIILGVGLFITYEKGDIPPNLLALMQWIYVSFVAGNAMEHYTSHKKEISNDQKTN